MTSDLNLMCVMVCNQRMFSPIVFMVAVCECYSSFAEGIFYHFLSRAKT